MNENIDLTKILKDCTKGTSFYSSVHGKLYYDGMCVDSSASRIYFRSATSRSIVDGNPILITYLRDGRLYNGVGECTIFPSEDQRDWSKFIAPWYKKEIKPKFHVGQYITDGYVSGQIKSIEDNYSCYKILDFNRGTNTTIPFTLQDNYHLWTIQDAKDGDVLALSWLEDKNLWEKIIIFKKYHSEGIKGLYNMPCVEGYGNTFKNGKMAFKEKVPYYSKTFTCNLHPATKEQRDLLFQKIKEACYKWNDETNTFEKSVEPKFDPKTLKPFDRVLVRNYCNLNWSCDIFFIYSTRR